MVGIKRIGSETWARVPYLVDHRLPAVCCSCHPEACLSLTWTSWRVGCSTREITHFQRNLRASTTFDPWSLSISTGNPHKTVATFVEKDTRYDRSLYPKWQIVWSRSLLTKFLKISIQFQRQVSNLMSFDTALARHLLSWWHLQAPSPTILYNNTWIIPWELPSE